MGFETLNLSKQLSRALDDMGFEEPTPIQQAVFPVARSGRDLIGIAQTGTGKTVAYLLPLLMKLHYAQEMVPRALVVVPTRELVVQVCEAVELLTEYMDIRCVGVYGGTNIRTQQERILEGVDLIVATPGRFMDIYYNGVIRTKLIRTVVVDEADRLMDLGFLPQLRRVLEAIPERHQTLLFSATFSDEVARLAGEFLLHAERIEVAPPATTVEGVHQTRYNVPNILTKINLLRLLLEDKDDFRRVMVFTETKRGADRIVERLADHLGEELSVIHSNKAQNTRLRALRAFREGESRVLVASDVAARGIDVADVSHVINFDIPIDPTEYVHRVGRTARAGHEGVAISLVSPGEEDRFEAIERLIGQQVPVETLPPDLEVSDTLLEEERVETANIVYQRGGPRGGGAFHERKSRPAASSNTSSRRSRSSRGRR